MRQLPPESRIMTVINPAKDWNWDKEVQSRILAKLDEISCIIVNSHKKKNAKKVEPAEQFQPDYVKEAKELAEKEKQAKKEPDKEELQRLKTFWQRRNRKVKMI